MTIINKLIISLLILYLAAFSESFYSNKKSMEIGGSVVASYSEDNYENIRYEVKLSPQYNFFPIRIMYLGPIVDVGLQGTKYSSGRKDRFYSMSFGGRAGAAFGKANRSFTPFLDIGLSSEIIYLNRYNSDSVVLYNVNLVVPANVGIKVHLKENLGLSISGEYKFKSKNYKEENIVRKRIIEGSISLRIGISGLIFKDSQQKK